MSMAGDDIFEPDQRAARSDSEYDAAPRSRATSEPGRINRVLEDPVAAAIARVGLAHRDARPLRGQELAEMGEDISNKNAELEKKVREIEIQISHLTKSNNIDLINSITGVDINPPENFSQYPTLDQRHQREAILKNSPFRITKYNGETPIMEFLNTCSDFQNIYHLSKQEFLMYMKNSTTGAVYEYIDCLINSQASCAEIYRSLFSAYNKTLNPADSATKLNNFKIYKNSNLDRVTQSIMILASRASKLMPKGPARQQYSDMVSFQTLIRALPPNSAVVVQREHSILSSRLGQLCTFNDLILNLIHYKVSIDKDIRLNGENAPAYKNNKKENVKNVNAIKTQASGQNNNNIKNKKTNNSPSPKAGNKNSSLWCSLCGLKSHTAVVCRLMIDNAGERCTVLPVSTPCSICPPKVSPRLNHPEDYCPWRIPHGIWSSNKKSKSD